MWWWTFRLDTSLPHAESNSWQAHPVWSLIIISSRQQILVEAIVQHLHKCLWHLRYSELRQPIPVSYCLIKSGSQFSAGGHQLFPPTLEWKISESHVASRHGKTSKPVSHAGGTISQFDLGLNLIIDTWLLVRLAYWLTSVCTRLWGHMPQSIIN